MGLKKLLEEGIVEIGKNAKGNPTEIPEEYCLGIAGKDYPAQTPNLWNAVFEQFGMKRRNIRLISDPVNIERVFAELTEDDRYFGGDVGVGFKDIAGSHLSSLNMMAEAMNAINVIAREQGKLVGYNTDGVGFAKGLEEILSKEKKTLKGDRIMLLGGGGTTNAIAFALAACGASLVILNRTVIKAQELATRVNGFFDEEIASFGGRNLIKKEAPNCGVIVSAIDDPHSPLDQYSALGEIELPATEENIKKNLRDAADVLKALQKSTIIADVMLRNTETATLRTAREAGFKTQNGFPMVLNQAIEAFWIVNKESLRGDKHTKEEVSEIMAKALK